MGQQEEQYQALTERLDALLKAEGQRRPVVLAIDGMTGAGKTTLAAMLSERYQASVVHLDDFFLPLPMRTAGRLAEPGGNVHYERFLTEVLHPLREETVPEFQYFPFLCGERMALSDTPKTVVKTPLVIVEGSYSMRPGFRPYYDCSVFLRVTPEEQERRLMRRNPERMDAFRQRWIPMESRYHTCLRPAEACTFTILNDDSL